MAVDKLTEAIRIVIETEGKKGVEELRAEFVKLGGQSEKTAADTQKLVGALDGLVDQAEKSAKLVRLNQELSDTSESLTKAVAKANEFREEIQRSGVATEKQAEQLERAENQVAKLATKYEKQATALRALDDELVKSGVDTAKLADEVDRLGREIDESARNIGHQANVLKANKEAAERSAKAYETFAKGLKSVRDNANDVATRLVKVGAAAATAAAAFAVYKTGQFFSGAIESAADFERQISEIAAVTGATGAELELLRDTARNAALESGIGFTDVTTTLGELARAVGDAEKATAILAPTLNLATAGGLEAAKAAEILTTTLTQFGLDALEATRVADLLSNGANATTASVEQLGNSLGYAAPLARQLGMSVDETVAAIGALADEGFRGERAGTALRNVLGALANPTSKLNSELDNLGIKTRNFNEVVVELANKGDAGKRALLALDAEARPAILALVNSGATNIARLTESFASMEVTAAGAAATIRDNLSGAAAQVGVAFDGLRQDLVQPILEPLTQELQQLAEGLSAFAKSPEFATIQQALKNLFIEGTAAAKEFIGTIDFKQVAADIAAFADGAGEKLKTFGEDSREAFGFVKEAVNGLSVAFNALQTGIFAIGAALAKAGAIGAEFAALQVQILSLVPAANAAAKAVGVDLGGAVDDLRLKGGALEAVYQEFATRTIANLEETSAAIDNVGAASDEAADSGKGIGDEIGAGLQPVLPELQAVDAAIRGLLPAAQAAASGYGVLRQESDATAASLARGGVAAKEAVTTVTESAQSATTVLSGLLQEQQKLALELANARVSGAAISELQRLQEEYDKTAQKIVEIRGLLAQPPPAPSPVPQQVGEITTSANEATAAVQQTTQAAAEGKTASLGYTDALAAFIATFGAVSENALQLFLKLQRGTIGVGITTESMNRQLIEAAEATNRAIDAQKTQADALGQSLQNLAADGTTAADALAAVGMQSAEGLEAFALAVREGRSSVNLLNQADLDRLADNAQKAANKIREIERAAQDAKTELADLQRQFQDEADKRAGNEAEIEKRRFEDQLRRIDELAAVGGAAAAATAAETRRLAEIEHQNRLAEIEAEARAKKKVAGNDKPPTSPTRPPNGGGGNGGGGAAGSVFNITVNANGNAEEIARAVKIELDKIQRRSR